MPTADPQPAPWSALAAARVLIVGGSSGIGEGCAALLSGLGATVVIAGGDRDRLDRAAASIGGAVSVEQMDGRSEADRRAMFARVGPFDHLVISLTGRLGGGPFRTLDLAELRQAFEEKFWPHLAIAQAALPTLRRTGSLTFITGIAARRTNPGGSGFAAINGALEIMTPTLALELAPLRVNAISPGLIATPWYDHLPDGERAEMFDSARRALPVERIGQPSDVAQALLYVIAGGFVTGSVIECDGGARLVGNRPAPD